MEPLPPAVPQPPVVPAAEPWRRRVLRTLLYGRNVDRTAKARARVGLAILAFGVVYLAIAARLVMFAAWPDSHLVRRGAAKDAIATARPDILDRNGMISATDVRAPSLFAEPRRIIDVDEAAELLTAVLPDLDATEVRERLNTRRGFVWLKREITPQQRQEIYRLGLPGVGFLSENKRVYPNSAEVSHLIGHVNIDNQGIAGIEKWLDGRGLADLHMAGLATDRLQQPVELAVDLRVQHALRDELIVAARQVQGEGRGRPGRRRAHRRDHLDGVGAGLRSQQPEAGQRSAPHQPADHRRVRDGLDLQGADAGDGARFRQGHAQLDVRRAHSAALRQVQHPRLSRAEPRADGAGDLHLFVQHRHRAHGAVARRRVPQVVPEEDGPARPAAHRIAGKRRAAGAQALGRAQHRDHRVRPRPLGRAVAGGDGDQRADERRLSHPADLHEAHQGRGDGARPRS